MNQREKIFRGILLIALVVALGIFIASGIIWAYDIGEGDRENEKFQVKTTVDDVTPLTLHIAVDSLPEKRDDSLCICHEMFIVERATILGWKEVKIKDPRRAIHTVQIPLGGTRDFEINWDTYYGALPKGTYRIGLTLYLPDSFNNTVGYCYATFKVTK